MITLGLKLTHDSSFSILEDNNLVLCHEYEKMNNNNRFGIIENLCEVSACLSSLGYRETDIDAIAIDGWIGRNKSVIVKKNRADNIQLTLAPYQDSATFQNVIKRFDNRGLPFFSENRDYESYSHAGGHILSAYCTSEFSETNEPSLVMIWDGGMYPTLYHLYFRQNKMQVKKVGSLFDMGVNIYSIFSQHFGPLRLNENVIKDELSIAGKVMAYTAYGNAEPALLRKLHAVYSATKKNLTQREVPCYPYAFSKAFKESIRGKSYSDENIITSFHYFLQDLLLRNLEKTMKKSDLPKNLCYAGGGALNIKWNAALRKTDLFRNIWIPPFPNDSGSSIGVACCSFFDKQGRNSHRINWDVYSGPDFIVNKHLDRSWKKSACSLRELAALLAGRNTPVLFLQGKAELGPRALGNRSILCPATDGNIKNVLNAIKIREPYRPVAPVCLSELSAEVFEPGGQDPYMLFEHKVRPGWRDRIPGILHLDGTARLQTVTREQNRNIYTLLKEYYELTGIPVLCNTSANFKGRGFFPDLESAMKWGKIPLIWSDHYLYTKNGDHVDSPFLRTR